MEKDKRNNTVKLRLTDRELGRLRFLSLKTGKSKSEILREGLDNCYTQKFGECIEEFYDDFDDEDF